MFLLATFLQTNSHLQHAMVLVSNLGRSIFSASYEWLAVIFDKLEKNISSKKIIKNQNYNRKNAPIMGTTLYIMLKCS